MFVAVKNINRGKFLKFFFPPTFVPCIMILSKFFIYQLMHKRIALKEILKFIKNAPTCFGLITIFRERTI